MVIGNGTPTNFFVDDVSIAPPAACDTPSEITWLDASALGATACDNSLFWDGDTTAFAGERIDGIGKGAAFPASVGADAIVGQSLTEGMQDGEQPEVFDESQDEDEFDGDEEAETSETHTIHLPLVNR